MNFRKKNIEKLAKETYDVLIIGAGINGAVSAAALAARGVKVALIDSRDFAGFTSQQSSNLVWGGIKYMESYEFGLVNNLCKSRNELLSSFPSTVREIRFLTTLSKNSRIHPWFMLAGAWLYWLFGRAKTRIPHLLSNSKIKAMEPLININNSIGGIEYSDAYLHDNDARFIFNFVQSAMDKGCVAANYIKSIKTSSDNNDHWVVEAEDQQANHRFTIRAKVLINATGAFVDELNKQSAIQTTSCHIFSKGIHLIVPRLSREKRVLTFFADDGRLFFAIPMANCTCIGTTDSIVENPITEVTEEDRNFVLSNINDRLDLDRPLDTNDIIAERCGVRPLVVKKGIGVTENFMQLSRKHAIETVKENKHISIFGGKLTDCLNVGEEVCEQVAHLGVQLKPVITKWYGEPDEKSRTAYFKRCHQLAIDQYIASDTGEMLSERLWRRYAEHALPMLDAIENNPRMAEIMLEGSGIRRCEIDYLVDNEMIVKLDDFLRRRSKLALLVTHEKLKHSRGLYEVCEQLFGEEASEKYNEYFSQKSAAENQQVEKS
jgi:glycerol-3-phosphate dehydrogenase